MNDIRETAERVAQRLLSGEKIEMPEAKMGVPKAMKKAKQKGASSSGTAPVAKSPGKVSYRQEDVEMPVAEARSKKMLNVIAKPPGKVMRKK